MNLKTICSAGCIGNFSYLIVDDGQGHVSTTIKNECGELNLIHSNIDTASLWVESELKQNFIKKNYEDELNY